MRAKITVQMDNAAFKLQDGSLELAEILEDLAKHVRHGERERELHDSNGYRVGTFKIDGKPARF
jgi:hypothetical protein